MVAIQSELRGDLFTRDTTGEPLRIETAFRRLRFEA
jgi:hypothetical protein